MLGTWSAAAVEAIRQATSPGMREMLAITGAIKGAGLDKDILLLTHGRCSGGTTGLCVDTSHRARPPWSTPLTHP